MSFGCSEGDKQSVPDPSHFQHDFLSCLLRQTLGSFRSPLSAQHPMFPPPGCEALRLCSQCPLPGGPAGGVRLAGRKCVDVLPLGALLQVQPQRLDAGGCSAVISYFVFLLMLLITVK